MSQSTPPLATVAGGLPAEEVQAELQAVLHSASFERSEKLQKFLSFICELTLRGESGRINEYLIGSEVFLRGPSYSPSEDSVVRRQAHSLRQKLQEYYAGEGKTNAIHIELPVGRYVPSFRRVEAEAVVAAAAQELEQSPSGVAGAASHRRRSASLAVLAVIASVSIGYLLGRRPWNVSPAETAAGPATAEIWAHWRQAPRPTVICFSSPMTAVIKHFDQALPASAVPARFRAHAAEETLFSEAFRVPPGGAYYFTPAVNQTKIGEAVAGVRLATLLTSLRSPVSTTQSRFVSWPDLRGDNMILLGNNEANQWLDPLLRDKPFRLTPTDGDHQRAILNTAPRPGESSEYVINYAPAGPEGDQEFSLISMLSGYSPEQRLLLINGLNSQATQAAAEFLTTELSLAALVERLRLESPRHQGPWFFQAIFKTEVHDKVPIKSWLVAVRVL